MKQTQAWLRARPWFLALLAVELLLTVLLGRRDWAVQDAITLTGADIRPYAEQTICDEAGCRLPQAVEEPVTFATTTWLALRRGSYQVTLEYRATGFGGQCYFINDTVQANTIRLGPESDHAVFTVQVPYGLEDAQLHFDVCPVDEDGNVQASSLDLLSLTIRPTHGLFRVQLALRLGLFLLLDLLLLLVTGGWAPLPTPRSRYLALGLGGIVLLASLPLCTDYLTWGHDLCYHLARIQGIADGLAAGQLPVRISPTLLHGDGYAGNVFYCDLFLYPAALLRIWGFSLQASYKAYLVAVNAATALVTWHCLRSMLGRDGLALLGSGLYTLSLYRLTNLYARGAVGEYTAMLFFPLVIYGLWRILAPEGEALREPGYKWCWVPLAVGFSGIVCCHVLSCEMAALLTLIACLCLIRRVLRPQSLLAFCKAVGASVLACAWFLVPFLDYFLQDSFSVNSITDVVPYNLTKTAVYLAQILMPFVNATGYSNPISMGMAGEMPLSMGLVPALAGAVLVLCLADGRLRGRGRGLGLACLGLGLLSAWMTTDLFPWYALADASGLVLTLLTALQYLWRFLAPATVLLLFAGLAGLELLAGGDRQQRLIAGASAALLVLLTLVSAGWLYYQVLDTAEPTRYYDLQDLDMATSQVGSGEYLPAESWLSNVWGVHSSTAGPEVTLLQADRTARDLTIACQAPEGGWVDTQLLHYRYYHALDTATGQELPISTGETGFLRVTLPAGYSGSFVVFWREPLLWRLAEAVSLLFFAGCGAALWARRRRKKREQQAI